MSRRKERRRKIARKRSFWNKPGIIIGVVVAVVIIGVLAFLALTREEPGEKFPSEGNSHLEAEPTNYIWQTRPATSGPHAPTIASWGESTETISPWRYVHNMEDGGVIIHYNCPQDCGDEVDELREIMRDVGRDRLILHPNSDTDSKFVLTAWQRMLSLDTVEREQIVGFIEAYRGVDHH